MSQETFGHAPQIQPLALRQSARPDDEKIGLVRLHLFDDGVDHMVHLHQRGSGVSFLDEIVPHRIDQGGRTVDHRFRQVGELRFRQVA